MGSGMADFSRRTVFTGRMGCLSADFTDQCRKKKHPEMRITIVSDSLQFFLEVSEICSALLSEAHLGHTSDYLEAVQLHSPGRPGGVLIAEPSSLKQHERGQILKNAFAVIGIVCQNKSQSIQWTCVSRDDLVLWLREQSRMTSSHSLSEDVVVQSPHVRLAQFRVPTDCRMIPLLRDRLLRGLRDYGVADGSRENHFCMALEEALNNAFFHGNLEISSELKEDGSSRFIELAAEREKLSPWKDRCVFVTELVSPFGTWITIQDEGKGFNVQAAIDRCNDPESLLASGRGLLLMRAFSDELFFNNSGNEVTLVLYSEGAHRELPLGTPTSVGAEPRFVLT
jgi:Histidine kinase-like ATPase domain